MSEHKEMPRSDGNGGDNSGNAQRRDKIPAHKESGEAVRGLVEALDKADLLLREMAGVDLSAITPEGLADFVRRCQRLTQGELYDARRAYREATATPPARSAANEPRALPGARWVACDHLGCPASFPRSTAPHRVECDRLTAAIEARDAQHAADRAALTARIVEAEKLLDAHTPGKSSGNCADAGKFPSLCLWHKSWGQCWEHRRRAFLAPPQVDPTGEP